MPSSPLGNLFRFLQSSQQPCYFIEEEIETQRRNDTCPRSHRKVGHRVEAGILALISRAEPFFTAQGPESLSLPQSTYAVLYHAT